MKDEVIGSMLYLSDETYSRIVGHLDRKNRERKIVEKEASYKKYLEEQSTAMEEDWYDSMKNIKKRENKKREEKEQMLKQIFDNKMKSIEEDHREERKKCLADINEKIKMHRQPNCKLSKALLESFSIAENEANLKLRKKIQLEEEAREAKWVDSIYKEVEEFNQKEEREKCEARSKSKLVQEFQLKQIQERESHELHLKNNQLKEEQDDIQRLSKEMEERRNIELEDYRNRKMGAKKYMQAYNRSKEEKNMSKKREESELNEVCKIYNDFYIKKTCLIERQKKQELIDATKARQILGFSNKQIDDNIVEKQNGILRKQIEEQEERYQQAKKQEAERKINMQKEMDKYYINKVMKKQSEDQRRAETLRFKIAERLKFDEEIEKHEEEKKKIYKNSKVEFKKGLEEQIEENKQLLLGSVKPEKSYNVFKNEDEKFFSYAKEVLEQARSRGFDERPIIREIKKYCKEHFLPLNLEYLRKEEATNLSEKKSLGLPKI